MWRVSRLFIGPSAIAAAAVARSVAFADGNPINNNSTGATSAASTTSTSASAATVVTDAKATTSSAKSSGGHKDCENPVCRSTSDMFKKALKGHTSTTTSTTSTTTATSGAGAGEDASTSTYSNKPRVVCPLDRDSLGREAWDVIHTVAAYYPEHPSPEQQEAAEAFIRGLSVIYPCSVCAADFQQSLIDSPPRVASRRDFVLWCCELHNRVNRTVGKAPVPCDLAQLDVLWRSGLPECGMQQTNNSLQHDHE